MTEKKWGSTQTRRHALLAGKYLLYAGLVLLCYILQNTPGFLEIFGVKPFLVIPAVISIAMFEGEFVGALYGAFGGMLCDLAANTFYGFYTLTLFLACAAVGLGVIYLMKNDYKTAFLTAVCYLGAMTLVEYLFYYLLYGYPGNWRVLVLQLVPRMACTSALTPLLGLGERALYERFERLTGTI